MHIPRSSHITKLSATAWLLAFSQLAAAQTTAQPKDLAFDITQLSGWWAESYSPTPACDPSNVRTRQVFSEDGKHLKFVLDRPWQTELGLATEVQATIVSSTRRTLTIRYDNESRKKRTGQPVEWELSIAAPGVYRWRETEWKPNEVNTVVGVRCTER